MENPPASLSRLPRGSGQSEKRSLEGHLARLTFQPQATDDLSVAARFVFSRQRFTGWKGHENVLCSALSHPTPRCFGSRRGCELNPTSQLGSVKWTRLIATSQAHPAFLQEAFLTYKSGVRILLHACAHNPCPRSLPSLGLVANSRLQRAEGMWPGPMRVPRTYSLGPSRKRSAESCSKGRGEGAVFPTSICQYEGPSRSLGLPLGLSW